MMTLSTTRIFTSSNAENVASISPCQVEISLRDCSFLRQSASTGRSWTGGHAGSARYPMFLICSQAWLYCFL
jgi:hypothetical protein